MNLVESYSYKRLERSAQHIFKLLSKNMEVNTFCITEVQDGVNTFCITEVQDGANSQIVYAFNRNVVLIESGVSLPLQHAYWRIVMESGREPLIIEDTSKHPVACTIVPSQHFGVKSFLGIPITLKDGTSAVI